MSEDISLKDVCLTKRVLELRKDYFRAVPEICIERPKLITQFSLKHKLFGRERISILDKARAYRHVLENRTAVVRQRSSRFAFRYCAQRACSIGGNTLRPHTTCETSSSVFPIRSAKAF